ncbi:MAG: heparan-alpha-glucosaminide N-acetyltransferase domain-containing protein [Candidatus Aminicenantes bacterium]|nr:heparan-alpha-glucosaminide N-acetyltransferase domain-containing protein [Candidatus Aminicenantes bacterium]MDH5383894.1 heparan-alpha-glucosaminide N-acetyltransferase domain-containing protein [Candidatus Aminicenantes bacterium]
MKKGRLSSLDAFRGITIAGMILVNNPGSWKHVYAPLQHAEWHGWTPTDLVFPFFLFIVGVSVSLALSKRIARGDRLPSLYFKIFSRSFILFALGIFLRLLFRFDFGNLRIPGVLQRIAICYLLSALIFTKVGTKGRLVISLFILMAYYLILKFVPVPGYGPGVLEYEGNLCGYIDVKILGGHLYKPSFDPEGILSTFPTIATTLIGTLTGDWLRSSKKVLQKTTGLLIAGIVMTGSGLLLHPHFPINKQLWTSTFVLFTSGAALVLLGLCFLLIDGIGFKKWAYPFLVLGTNAIFVYAGSIVMAKLLVLIKVSTGQGTLTLQAFINKNLLVPLFGSLNGSLLFALLFILLWIVGMIPFYRNQIFIKV